MSKLLAITALIFAAALWATNGIAARLIGDAFQPIFLSWARWLVALLILLPFAWMERIAIQQAFRSNWRLIGLLSALANVPQSALVYKGLQTTTVINVGLLNSTIPVLVLILGHFFFRRRMRLRETIGVLTSLIGVCVLLFEGSTNRLFTFSLNKGDVFAFIAMLTWAIYTLLISRKPNTLSLLSFVFCMSLVGVVICAPFVLVEAWFFKPPEFRINTLLPLIYIAVGPTLAGTLCLHMAQHI